MGYFKTWLESTETKVLSIDDAKKLSQASGLDVAGMEFDKIEDALAHDMPISYDDSFPLSGIEGTRGDIPKVLRMMGAFAQRMGVDAPETLEDVRKLKIRDAEFKKMTPPVIVHKSGEVIDGKSRVTAAKLLQIGEIRAFVIG